MDEKNTIVEAIAIKDGKIVEVGPERQILNRYSAEEVIDAKMKDVYPGFTDAHAHILSYAKSKLGVNLYGSRSYAEMIAKIEKYQSKKQRSFIIGGGWDQSIWGESELPNNDRLSEEFPDIPVCLFRIDGHALMANDFLLKQVGLLQDGSATPDYTCQGGYFVMDSSGFTGIAVDNAMNKIIAKIPDYSEKEMRAAILEIQSELLSYGITGVHEAGMLKNELDLMINMVDDQTLQLNIYGMLLPTEENIAFARKNGIYEHNNLLVRSFKVFGDGALGSRGAFLKQVYSDHHDHKGYLITEMDEIKRIAGICEELNYQMNTHAIGDSTNRLLLDVYQDIYSRKPDHRWRMEHAQVVDPADFILFAKSGAFPSVQPTHAVSDQRWAEDRLGKNRMKGAYAYNSLLQQFGAIAIGTDFPVEYPDPFRTIHAAVNRKNSENIPSGGFLASERITLEECLRGMTSWAALAAFQEKTLGTLEKGKDATLVIFEKPIEAWPDYQPNYANTTIIKGKKVHSLE